MNKKYSLLNEFLADTPTTENEICGCYVLRNNRNHKYYVGQSKHVRQRQREHWYYSKGKLVEPKNHLFSKDWYHTPRQKRPTLFSIQVIPCKREELNATETSLIQKYHSFKDGYNKTRGVRG